jgi:hypothetical protein
MNAASRPLYPQERDPVSIVQETGWSRGPTFLFPEQTVVLQLTKKFFVMEYEDSSWYSLSLGAFRACCRLVIVREI